MSTKKEETKKKETKKSAMEELLGPSLLTSVNTAKPTDEVLKDKPLVAVYFSAAWCPPCKGFTPILIDFYKQHSKDIEIVYVSSDHSSEEFAGYFGSMPWVAHPIDKASALLKQEFANKVRIKGIPTLIVLETKTGNFITDVARDQVTNAMQGKTSRTSSDLIENWKQTEAVSLDEAQLMLTGGRGPMTVMGFFALLLKNPMYVIALVYFAKKLFLFLAAMGKKGDGEL